MKILYVAMKYDYGQKDQGYSIEHLSFYRTLKQMGHHIIYFDFLDLFHQYGKDHMNSLLLAKVKKTHPDFLFLFPFQDQIDWQIIKNISQHTNTLTFAWFDNCVWRYHDFYSHIATSFNIVGTTQSSYVPLYKKLGVEQVIHVQWGINPHLHRPYYLKPKYQTSFIGRPHGTRKVRLSRLRKLGMHLNLWGPGTPNGKVNDCQMVKIFNQSKINLNLTESSHQGLKIISQLRHKGWLSPLTQMKARIFEIPGSGAFMLSQYTPDIEIYYRSGQEIETFTSMEEAVAKNQYYLNHDTLRQKIARRGYDRTIKYYTYKHRFQHIFKVAGLAHR